LLHDDGKPLPRRVDHLAERVRAWVRPDGSVRPEDALPSTTDADYLPGNALLALVRYSQVSGHRLDVDWVAAREWYTRRFRLLHPWGLAYWHCQLWPAVARLTGDASHLAFPFEVADWMTERQLRADGSFLTDMCPTGPSWHTACAAIGVAAACRAAVEIGDAERADRYATSWRDALRFLDRLIVRPDDAYWMPDPVIAVGGIRATVASYEMRIDATSETLQALLEALPVEHDAASAKA
jgi:hypothetical protein